jgi:hypothetical protein
MKTKIVKGECLECEKRLPVYPLGQIFDPIPKGMIPTGICQKCNEIVRKEFRINDSQR